MTQSSEFLPDVPHWPAPWSLRGHAWMVALRLPAGDPARTAFVPADLRATLKSVFSVLMCVAYDEAPCGPYRELLFIPGTMDFGDARHPSISRILVSTWDSVVNGRSNWGIPKDRADFDWTSSDTGDRWRVISDGREICALEFTEPTGMRLPLRSSWAPRGLGTLAQRQDGRNFYYQPEATGSLRLCRLRQWRFDPELFPDLSRATVLTAMRIEDFRMVFPIARQSRQGGSRPCEPALHR
jgi:hypothetical protein